MPIDFFKDLRGAANQKRLKNTGVDNSSEIVEVTKLPIGVKKIEFMTFFPHSFDRYFICLFRIEILHLT